MLDELFSDICGLIEQQIEKNNRYLNDTSFNSWDFNSDDEDDDDDNDDKQEDKITEVQHLKKGQRNQ